MKFLSLSLFVFVLLASCRQDVKKVGPYFTYLHHHDEYRVTRAHLNTQRGQGGKVESQVSEATDRLILFVEEMEQALLDSAEQADPRLDPSSRAPDLEKLLDNRIASSFLIGDQPAKPVSTPFSAYTLNQRLQDHKRLLHELTGIGPEFFDGMLHTGSLRASHNSNLENWETAKFWNMSLLHALDELTLIKSNLLRTEFSLIQMELNDPLDPEDRAEHAAGPAGG